MINQKSFPKRASTYLFGKSLLVLLRFAGSWKISSYKFSDKNTFTRSLPNPSDTLANPSGIYFSRTQSTSNSRRDRADQWMGRGKNLCFNLIIESLQWKCSKFFLCKKWENPLSKLEKKIGVTFIGGVWKVQSGGKPENAKQQFRISIDKSSFVYSSVCKLSVCSIESLKAAMRNIVKLRVEAKLKLNERISIWLAFSSSKGLASVIQNSGEQNWPPYARIPGRHKNGSFF